MTKDTYKTLGLRRKMLESLKEMGIQSQSVLDWMDNVPRHAFLESAFINHAYEIKAFPIAEEQTISSPYTVAHQTELLDVKPHHKVLEIGTGSGYQCAVLCQSGADVHSIEYVKPLYDNAKALLNDLGLRPALYHGDGSMGLPQMAPFDRIIVTAAAPATADHFIEQLNIGGILIIPVGSLDNQKMMKYKKINHHTIEKKASHDFKFVPLKGQCGWSQH